MPTCYEFCVNVRNSLMLAEKRVADRVTRMVVATASLRYFAVNLIKHSDERQDNKAISNGRE